MQIQSAPKANLLRLFPRWIVSPATVVCLVSIFLIGVVIDQAGGDPLELARLGAQYTGDPNATGVEAEGYDGQFVYFIALELRPDRVGPLLDVPAYRYQRILLPLLARTLALGQPAAIPWTIPLVGILGHILGTWAVGELLSIWGVSRWYALVYGLWAGFLLAIRLDLPEPLAYGLVAGALLAGKRGRRPLSWVLFSLALFAKEVTILFILAQLGTDLLHRRWRDVLGLASVALVPFGLFQAGLWWVFGQPGIGSGGAMSTPFEIIPYMGLWRIGAYSLAYLGAMFLVFGPAIVLPSIWGVWASIKKLLANERNVIVLGLCVNALVIAFLPFSTFRETGGLIRFAGGFVLAVLLFAGRYRQGRVLNYSFLWFILNAFLLKS